MKSIKEQIRIVEILILKCELIFGKCIFNLLNNKVIIPVTPCLIRACFGS